MIELVGYEDYIKLSPEERMLQRLQGLGELLAVTGWQPLSREELSKIETMTDDAPENNQEFKAGGFNDGDASDAFDYQKNPPTTDEE